MVELARQNFKARKDNKKYQNAVEAAVLGSKFRPRHRHRFLKQCATTLDQIDMLIDCATDPAILGRTYHGWNSWL